MKLVKNLLEGVAPEVILKAANQCDGWTIFDPKIFIEIGLPKAFVATVTATHKPDGSPKGSISSRGKSVKALNGVYGLHLLKHMATELGVTYASKFGRGSQADAIIAALQKHFKGK